MADGELRAFRLSLIDQLSRTRFARSDRVLEYRTRIDLAGQLGVTEEVLAEATKIATLATANAEASERVFVALRVPAHALQAWQEMHALAAELKLGKHGSLGLLLRSLCHAVMLSDREPAPRPWADWTARPGKRRKPPGPRERALVMRGKGSIVTFWCAPGLSFALEARSQAFGTTRQDYLRHWILELLDGDLVDVTFVPVACRATFARAEQYVLPVRPKASDLLPEGEAVALDGSGRIWKS